MTTLNKAAYDLLDGYSNNSAVTKKQSNTSDWYDLTYPLFQNVPLNTEDDFWKIVAYTYSWMPTIPTIDKNPIKPVDVLLTRIQELRNGNADELQPLLEKMIPAINNSLTAVSKILHFIAPAYLPIIDSNVILGWNVFFGKLHPEYSIKPFSKYPVSLDSKISLYLRYKNILDKWVLNCDSNPSLRELETSFFKLGQRQERTTKKTATSINE